MILMEMMLEVVIGVLVMEVDKVADMVLKRWPTCRSRYLMKTTDVTGNW